MIQVPSLGDSSGWPDGYEDLESGDNGFPGDTDEGETSFFSRPEIVVVCVVFVCSLWRMLSSSLTLVRNYWGKKWDVKDQSSCDLSLSGFFSSLTAACGRWGSPVASRTRPTETSPSTWSCTTLTSFWCPPRGSSLWQRTDTFMLRWDWNVSLGLVS